MLLSDKEAVIFWVRRIVGYVEAEGFPAEMGFVGVVLKPFIAKLGGKAGDMSEADAASIIDQIHALSYKLEMQTGKFSPYHYESDIADETFDD